MDWSLFHIGTAAAAFFYASFDRVTFRRRPFLTIVPHLGGQHLLGAGIMIASALLSWASRMATGDDAPLAYYAGVDLAAIVIFSGIMARRQAAWAALCVLLRALQLGLILYVFEAGLKDQTFNRWVLGALEFLQVLTVFTATMIGRHDRFARLDDINLNLAVVRLRSWSGVRHTRALASGQKAP